MVPRPEPEPEEETPEPDEPEAPEEEPPEPEARPEKEPEPDPPRTVKLEVYPEMASYPTDGAVPVTIRVLAPRDPRPTAGTLFVRVDDGEWQPLPGRVEIPGGRIHDRFRGVDLRQAVPGLTTGTHTVQAAMRREDGADPVASEPVEIFIEPPPDPGGGGEGEQEDPSAPEPPEEPPPEETPPPEEPPPGAGPEEPEPPPAAPELPAPPGPTVVVAPIFDEAETVKKIGPALVFDPDAPRGEPPPERPLEERYAEFKRRAEDAIARDEIPPEWRRVVRRYFELIRPR
jgi:hypothetical protein